MKEKIKNRIYELQEMKHCAQVMFDSMESMEEVINAIEKQGATPYITVHLGNAIECRMPNDTKDEIIQLLKKSIEIAEQRILEILEMKEA